MNKKFKIINYVLTIGITFGLVFLAVLMCDKKYSVAMKDVIVYYVIGFLVTSIICSFLHELGHLIFGKASGFVLTYFSFWFFTWERNRNKIKFSLAFNFNESGGTEMVKKTTENLGKGLANMTRGGLLFSFITMLIGIIPLIVSMPIWLYCILICFLPVGSYYFFGNILPSEEEGLRNDGGILYGLKREDDETKVLLALLSIQSELYQGKTFGEIDEKYYFDLPQLPEDSVNFILLLNYRYYYYLDKQDFEYAKKIIDRLMGLEEYMPKQYINVIKTEALFAACTFDFDADKADELMYELENYLHKNNTATSFRVKLAYILNIKQEKDVAEYLYGKGLRLAKKSQLKGLKLFENKQLEKLKEII